MRSDWPGGVLDCQAFEILAEYQQNGELLSDDSMGEFARKRVWLSDFGTRTSKLVCRCDVSYAMSGFFLVDRAYFQQVVPGLPGAYEPSPTLASGPEIEAGVRAERCLGMKRNSSRVAWHVPLIDQLVARSADRIDEIFTIKHVLRMKSRPSVLQCHNLVAFIQRQFV